MDITINTPALLFPAITLLLLPYTNRFLAVATLIRSLHKKYLEFPDQKIIHAQLVNLRSRILLIKWMQIFGVISFIFCVSSMISVFNDLLQVAKYMFGGSLFALAMSLFISLRELHISTRALEMELSDME